MLVLDPLPLELDETTIAVSDGGAYHAPTRTVRWLDPVVPPHEPRSVSFSVAVRGDATPGTRIRNVGTIVFPDAVPPSRIDTNFVEHVIPVPGAEPEADLRVGGCAQTAPGEWLVRLENRGAGFAYGVTATVLDPPPGVSLGSDTVRFHHPDDPDPSQLATVVPATTTESADRLALATAAVGDPCEALSWRIAWRDAAGEAFTRDVAGAPDADGDAVPDARDGCPQAFDPGQQDLDGDGAGDACDACPADPATAGPCPTPSPATREVCGNCVDDDGDGRIDLRDADCAASEVGGLAPLDLERGILSLAPLVDRDGVSVRGSLPLPSAGPAAEEPFDQARSGVTVSFFAGDQLIACFPTPAGAGWHTSANGRLWRFRDRRDDSLADPAADERLRIKVERRKVRLFARFRELALRGVLAPGEITTAVAIGERGYTSTDRWRGKPGGLRVVTP